MNRTQRQALHLVAFAAAIAGASALEIARVAPAGIRTARPLLVQATPSDALRPGERAFVVDSVGNARAEAELARLAVSQATSSRLRELAQQIAGDYVTINSALEALARRKAVAVPLQPVSFGDEYRRLAAVTGTPFDRAYLRALVAANERALRLCEAAVANARDADIRDLAGSLLPVIRDHVNKSTELARDLP